MRLWHVALIPALPCRKTTGDKKKNQLGGQHQECCAARGKGWGRRHEIVDYAWNHPPAMLCRYHFIVMRELIRRGYNIDGKWWDPLYRGKRCPPWPDRLSIGWVVEDEIPDYPEHDDAYLAACIQNLAKKNIYIKEASDGTHLVQKVRTGRNSQDQLFNQW
jgi:uncharacterized protein (TIGR02328 family)